MARQEEYQALLSEMKERVEARPLLFERTAQVLVMPIAHLAEVYIREQHVITFLAGKRASKGDEEVPGGTDSCWS